MRRFAVLALACAAVTPLGVAAPASARSSTPTITKVSPLTVKVGRNLYLRGRNFVPGNRRNTVVFQRTSGRALFVRAGRSTATKLVVRVPARIAKLLDTDDRGNVQPTMFRLRVVGRRASSLTSAKLSPRVTASDATGGGGTAQPSDCDSDGVPNSSDADDDNDLLPDGTEASVGLNACSADTDGDGLEDGWEYWSARDLNARAVPYPGKRPYPNPLDPSDAAVDFDGDTLTAKEEFTLWAYTGRRFDPALAGPGPASPLGYSDGTQTSRPDEVPPAPDFKSDDYGIPFSAPAYPAAYDQHDPGVWSDEERDGDVDGLSNYLETHGPATQAYWRARLKADSIEPWPKAYWGEFTQRPFSDPGYVDPDSDGDTLLDAEDDQDSDDWTNVDEMAYQRQVSSRDESGAAATRYVNPFNPCAPDGKSRTCPPYVPIG